MIVRFSLVLGVMASALLATACSDNEQGEVVVTPPPGGGSEVPPPTTVTGFRVTNLVTNQTDPDLINPWGIVPDNGLFWIADNGTGKVSVFDGNGRTSAEHPTGRFDLGEGITGVTDNENPNAFLLPCNTMSQMLPAEYIFASENGFLIAINDTSPISGVKVVDRSAQGANFKGVAIADMTSGPTLLAADFANARIDMFDAQFKLITPTPGKPVPFADPQLPAGWAPFNVITAIGHVYVMEAKQGQGGDEEKGAGLGAVAIFDMNGTMLARITSGSFNAPWGLTVAEATSALTDRIQTLLVGNFGDGHITAFDTSTLRELGQLKDTAGNALAIDGLWGLQVGSPAAGDPNLLYFVAGPADETAGVFGRIARVTVQVPEDQN